MDKGMDKRTRARPPGPFPPGTLLAVLFLSSGITDHGKDKTAQPATGTDPTKRSISQPSAARTPEFADQKE